MTWLDYLMKATEESESPRKYYYWAGLSAISGVVKNQVYLDKHYYKLYPNIYVLLVGRSGIRKGPPISLATKLVSEVNNNRVLSGRVSIQAVTSELSKAKTSNNGGPPITDATCFLSSPEFASFLVQDPQALTILTNLYDGDYNADYQNLTKGSGSEKLKNICVTMIGASNEIYFKQAVPDDAMGGGFVARTNIIYADKKSVINSLTRAPKNKFSVSELAEYLKMVAYKAKGEFKWSDKGRDLYDAWYNTFSEGEYLDTTGTMERLHDHILKAAMLISLSRDVNLVLEEEDIRQAIKVCEDFVPGSRRVAMGGGHSVSATGTATFLKLLLARKDQGYSMSRVKLLQNYNKDFDAFELDRITESLEQAKAITIKLQEVNGKRELIYTLTEKIVDNYLKMQKED